MKSVLHETYIEIPTELVHLVTSKQAWHYGVIPKSLDANNLYLFVDKDKTDLRSVEELSLILKKKVILESLPPKLLRNSLIRYYPKRKKTQQAPTSSIEKDDFLLMLFREARDADSSDIHIEAYQNNFRIRIRIDGMLIEKYKIKPSNYPSLINRIKIKANLDISEKRLPQDGRIYIQDNHESYDVRVSILPTFFGEKIVMRLLRNDISQTELKTIGFTDVQYQNYLSGIRQRHGIVLISGPTGSGKTTTLYSSLKVLNTSTRNIMTIEDPIEYTLVGVNQVQVKENIGFTFAKGMRSFLRQDPDVIMLGEIRDNETAQMAIRASLTGHLVLSTIHTNSAWGTIGRLIDMGVPPFLIASTLNTSVAQRLIRLLCSHCKSPDTDPQNMKDLSRLGIQLSSINKSVGCEACYFTGYSGRKAVFEVIPITDSLADSIKDNNSNVTHILKSENIPSLQEGVLDLLKQGDTSFEEAYPILLSKL